MAQGKDVQRAVVLEEVKRIAIRDVELQEPFGPRDVRIAIKSVGICGSDVHYYQVCEGNNSLQSSAVSPTPRTACTGLILFAARMHWAFHPSAAHDPRSRVLRRDCRGAVL
jgi:hypothetical protein